MSKYVLKSTGSVWHGSKRVAVIETVEDRKTLKRLIEGSPEPVGIDVTDVSRNKTVDTAINDYLSAFND